MRFILDEGVEKIRDGNAPLVFSTPSYNHDYHVIPKAALATRGIFL